MTRIAENIEIAASSTVVFRFCHDVARRSEWDERVVSVELLTSMPIRRGALLRIDARHAARPVFTWDAEYVEFQFPSSSRVRVVDAAPSSLFETGSEKWQFDSVGSATRFTLVWEYKPRGFLGGFLDKLRRRSVVRQAIKHSLVNLKEMVEAV